jgi:hypothetical protein
MPEFDAEKMNKAANDASLELGKIKETYPDAYKAIEEWAKKWVPTAGYKRLGKIIAGRWE